MTTIYETFGRRVRERREALGMTQKNLTMSIGFYGNIRWLDALENCCEGASLDGLVLLADALECTTDYLLGRSETP